MEQLFLHLAEQPILTLFILVGAGMYLGHLKFRSISLGAAAVLFLGIAVSAWANTYGAKIELPHEFGLLGLALFAFAIGVTSGRSFFSTLSKSVGPLLAAAGLLCGGGLIAFLLGKALGMNSAEIGGVFAGATTNTPALAAAGKSSGNEAEATVAYAICYLLGVLIMLIGSMLAVHYGKKDTDKPKPLIARTIRVELDTQPSVRDIEAHVDYQVRFSRWQANGHTHEVKRPSEDTKLQKGNLVTVVGPEDMIQEVVQELGHTSSLSLTEDRTKFDFRRITVSDPKLSGRTIAELHLDERYEATISRVRRGDSDMLGRDDLQLQLGDRVRVVAPTKNLAKLSNFFGDSSTGLSSLNPVALGLGMTLGILIGEFPFLTPSGEYFSIGSAAGTLIVGLIFGRLGRIGNFPTVLPHTTCQVLSELGLLVFLAQAGCNAGSQIAIAFTSGDWVKFLLAGAVVTAFMAASLYVVMRYAFHMGGTRLSGMLGGCQTQPAILAFANAKTNLDPRVALGYSMVYPMAMVVKILVAQVLGGL